MRRDQGPENPQFQYAYMYPPPPPYSQQQGYPYPPMPTYPYPPPPPGWPNHPYVPPNAYNLVYSPPKNPLSDIQMQTDPIKISKKPDSQFQFNTLYKKPLESDDFQEFRANTLPMIRINKLKKIQALVRGWYTRKFILPYKRRLHKMGLRVTEELIEEFIEDNLLPDIILEIINTNFAYKDYSLYKPDYRILLQIADGIENIVVNYMCEEAVKEITRFIVGDYLRKRNEELIVNKKFDALSLIIDEYLEIILGKDLPLMVKEIIKEEADDYLFEGNIANLMRNQFIPIYCREIINEAAWEIAEENFLQDCLEFIIAQHINDVIIDSAEAEKDRVDLEMLENAFAAFMQRSILKEAINELLLMNQEYHDEEYLRNNAEKVPVNDLSDFVMDKGNRAGDDDFFSNSSPEAKQKYKINKDSNPKNQESKTSFLSNDSRSGMNSKDFEKKIATPPKQDIPLSPEYKSNNLKQSNDLNNEGPYSGLTAPKSPRNRLIAPRAGESPDISQGRRGTKTFYQNK